MTPPADDIDSVLLPTDGSDGALAGAKRGIDLAVAAEADVHVLSVVDTSELEESSVRSDPDEDDDRTAIHDGATAAVDAVETMVGDRAAGIEVTTMVDRGTPFRAISSYVDEVGIDVVAMGTKGRTGLDRIVLGSVTENVLRTVDVPVLAVPPDASDASLTPETVDDILLPTDGSDGATVAVDWGVDLATVFDAMVHAVFSVDTKRLITSTEPSTILTELEHTGEDALQTVRDRARAEGVSVTGTVAKGPPSNAILDSGDTNDADLIVMGTHGRSGLERHLLGSVTENVVRAADVPVVCVPLSQA